MKKLFLYIFAFILIYYINLLPSINPYLFPLLCFATFSLLEVFSTKKRLKLDGFQRKISKTFALGIIASAVYFALVYLMKNEEVSFYGTRIIQNLMFFVYFWIVMVFEKYLGLFYESKDEKMAFLFRVACIQGIICLAMLLFPQLKSIADNLFVASSKFAEGDYILVARIYGISNSYTYGLPILHGLLSGICFYYGAVKNKKYFWYFPLILLVAILNGRTGLIISIILIIMTLFYLIIKSKYKIKILLIMFGAIIFSIITITILQKVAPESTSFISIAFNEISGFMSNGELSGTSQYLLQDYLYFPEGFDLIFGAGIRPYQYRGDSVLPTDIGFVNDLFMGGIVYVSILYCSYLHLVNASFNEKSLKFVKVLIITALLIANWKGEIFKNATFIIGLFFVTIINLGMRINDSKKEVLLSGKEGNK